MLRTISILFWLACLTPRPFAAEPKLVSVKKIWDKAPHCAFTDLARFQKRWLCTFREAKGHDSVNGTVRVIESVDGMSWKSAASLSEAGIDLRDPKLSQMPDGRLMLLMGGIVNRGGKYLTRAPRVSFSHDGYDWSRPKKVLSEDHWLWRVTWHKGKGWCLSKLNEGRKPRRGFLYWTKDGIDWNYVTEFEIDGVSETTLRFLPDETMVALVRPKYIGTSKPPYQKWTFHTMKHGIGGPNFIRLPDGSLWAGGRKYDKQSRTALSRMTPGSFEHVLELPSGGDTSYPGMVMHQGLLWMSYYSSHEAHKTSIYLAKIRFE